jgi:hypothetical protein
MILIECLHYPAKQDRSVFFQNIKSKKMKLIILGIAIASSSFTSCNNNDSSTGDTTKQDTAGAEITKPVVEKDSASAQAVIAEYLKVKNALVAGKAKNAADAAKTLNLELDKMADGAMTDAQQKAFGAIREDLKEHAEHIASNGGDIKHQREHFQLLSKDVYDLVKAFGSTQTIYKDYCPMVKAIWLSETKPIKNPYYGSSMLTCGEVQETIQQ